MRLYDDSQITAPVAKAVTVLSLSATSWSLQDISLLVSIFAGAAAGLYSIHLIFEWWWKKFWRPLFRKWKWLKPSSPFYKSTR